MTEQYQDAELCEACGCSAEVGFMIKEGDEVSQVSLFSGSAETLKAEFDKYLALAKSINQNVQFEASNIDADTTEMHVNFKFEVTAEKLIFDLKSRTLSR
ncbi:hypothetical protein ST37_06015 [Vibrio sp. qd031]|uniref:DUF406 family protein n=1 Tax=Vibrio sp. qd031 TaxID=1603038 RepID=UPI000A12029E|nr:DUF406 family protein [Vibrio sp. qd031]ORT50950.1 hypothetical protein ST37_06015 [Vibrio sp. qd031]